MEAVGGASSCAELRQGDMPVSRVCTFIGTKRVLGGAFQEELCMPGAALVACCMPGAPLVVGENQELVCLLA